MSADTSYQPLIVAHRGAWWDGYPENSHEAFEEAARRGFPAECDVWETADGKPIVIHDETLNRTTTATGLVSHFSSTQLAQISTRQSQLEDFGFNPPPLLEEVADLVHYIEIKPSNAKELVKKVIRIMRGKKWVLQSFYSANLEHALSEDAKLPVAFLADDADSLQLAIVNKWNVNANHELLDERTIHKLRDRGLRIGTWTVNEIPDIRRMLDLQVDVLITDRPKRAKRIITSAGLSISSDLI